MKVVFSVIGCAIAGAIIGAVIGIVVQVLFPIYGIISSIELALGVNGTVRLIIVIVPAVIGAIIIMPQSKRDVST